MLNLDNKENRDFDISNIFKVYVLQSYVHLGLNVNLPYETYSENHMNKLQINLMK